MIWIRFSSITRGMTILDSACHVKAILRIPCCLCKIFSKNVRYVGYFDGSEFDPTVCRKKPKYGSRYLKNINNVFKHNAWDHVEWDSEQEEEAKRKVDENSDTRVDQEQCDRFDADASKYWDDFYEIHQNRFFKDRRWIFTEFPEIAPNVSNEAPQEGEIVTKSVQVACEDIGSNNEVEFGPKEGGRDSGKIDSSHHWEVSSESSVDEVNQLQGPRMDADCSRVNILEVGCGVGNTVFPILQTSADPNLFVYCCDFSSAAIQLVKDNPEYDPKRCHAFVCDVTSDEWKAPFPPNSLDFVILIFVLSAVHPDKMSHVAKKLFHYLKPGGMVMFRDYGLYDMAQLRFKKGRCLSENFYARGDGTRVYFFSQGELKKLFEEAGFQEKENVIDRRLQVNRGKLLKMYRVWVQAKYQKPMC